MSIVMHPKTAGEALNLWNAGESIAAFRVESQGATQEQIYSAAFALVPGSQKVFKAGMKVPEVRFTPEASSQFAAVSASFRLTDREVDAAHSIAYVAVLRGWEGMLQQHIGEHIPAITIRKN